MKMYGVMELQLHAFLTSALYCEWLASRPGCFTSGEGAPVTDWIGDWLGPRSSLDAVAKKNFSCSYRELNPSRPARSLVTLLRYK